MRQACWAAGLALCLGGCTTATQERLRAYNEDGVALFQRGDYWDARDSFKAALALKPNDPGLLYDLGQCYDRLGNVTQAENTYNQCLKAAPNHPECRHALAVLLVHTGRQGQAAAMIADWLAREPKLASPYAEYGWFLHYQGDLPRAQAELQRALELDPHNPRALTELALLYEHLHRPERAVALYERILRRDPKQAAIAARVQFLLAKGAGKPRPE